MEAIHNDVEDISATTEQLSAGMEETSASSQEMSSTTITIEAEIEGVTHKTDEGQKLSVEIKDRADNLKAVTLDSQRNATDLYNATNTKLRSSIERASAIEEIKALSQTIASLANQTNLLALNASIEAARAGDAGKGFAVVAHEIGQLSNNSQKAVSKIETITHELSQVVDDMIEDSNSLLDFVDNKVIPDYGVLVQTGEQYSNDANAVEDMMTNITKSTVQLYESIQYLRNTITEVASATEEGSKGSSEIAERSSSIFNQTNVVLKQSSRNLNIAQELSTLVQYFNIKEV